MEKSKFVHLHVHSDNSLLKGYGTITEYVTRAKELGMEALALTDANTMTGIYQFIAECKKENIKPIVGVEFNMAPITNERFPMREVVYQENVKQIIPNRGANTHLTVLAKNDTGLHNLFLLLNESFHQDHFYIVPRIDLDLLIKYKEGLIILSGDPDSELNIRLRYNQIDKAKEYASRMKAIFGDDFYIELMEYQSIPDYSAKKLAKLARELEIETVLTNDVHYLDREDAVHQEHFMAVGANMKLSETPTYRGGIRPALGGNSRNFADYDQMYKTLPYLPAINNTIKIADKIETVNLEYDVHLRPKPKLPEGFNSDLEYFDYLVEEGFKKKRAHQLKEIQEVSREKIAFEREVILSNDFISYFLVVQEYLQWSINNGYPIGPGRGSVGGSEIAYLLNISNTDPIRFNLLFERFISDGRGAIFEIEYEDGEKEQIIVSEKKKVNGQEKYIYQLEVGDVIEDE